MKIQTGSEVDDIDQSIIESRPSLFERRTSTDFTRLCCVPSEVEQHIRSNQNRHVSPKLVERTDTPRYLVTMYKGIGDAVIVGLSLVDQIIQEDPRAFGKIDVLCNTVQAELFEHDPRINRIILTSNSLFSPSEMTMWLNGITLDTNTASLVHFLRERRYEAVFAFMFAPGFYLRLHSTIVYPNLLQLGKDFWSLSRQVDVPMSKIARRIVSNYFGKKRELAGMSDEIPLYISSEPVKNAKLSVNTIKERSKVSLEAGKLLVVATDSTSAVTRPPVHLLAASIAEALRKRHELIVCILQGYTDASAAQKLFEILTPEFQGRIFLIPAEPRSKLLDVAAFIDQSDVFITGDTGLMHIAAATKKCGEGNDTEFYSGNSVKIIVLFGGTNPGFYGYCDRTIIIGKGRKEQMAFIPGIAKESYNPKGQNLFDHISPHHITEAILST